jgi:hypothetical protein
MHQAVSEAPPDHHQYHPLLWDPPDQGICQL